jgi:hypothetical protein
MRKSRNCILNTAERLRRINPQTKWLGLSGFKIILLRPVGHGHHRMHNQRLSGIQPKSPAHVKQNFNFTVFENKYYSREEELLYSHQRACGSRSSGNKDICTSCVTSPQNGVAKQRDARCHVVQVDTTRRSSQGEVRKKESKWKTWF